MSKQVMTKEQTESKLDRMLASMKKFIVGEPSMKMVIAADGETEIDFTDLADDDTPAVDDVATVDGSPAEGEYLMPNGETYVFAAGILTEIKPAESTDDEGEGDDSEEMAQLKADNAEMKAKAAKDAKAIKALEKSNAEMKTSLEENKSLMKGFKKDMEAVKASMKSDFQSEEGSGNEKKPGTKTRTRKVFK